MKKVVVNIDQLSVVLEKFIDKVFSDKRYEWLPVEGEVMFFINKTDDYKMIYVSLNSSGWRSNVMYFDEKFMITVERFFPIDEKTLLQALKKVIFKKLNISGIYSVSAAHLNQD
jgi:hypothetical protein